MTPPMASPQPGPRILERFVATSVITMALAVVLVLGLQRFDLETQPRSIEIAFPEKRIAAEALKNPEALERLRSAGVTTLVRIPYTLDDMIRYGLAEAWHPEKDLMEIRLADNQLTSNATIYLTGQFGMAALQIRIREQSFICDVRLPAPIEKIEPDRFILEIPSGPIPEGFRSALLLPAGDWGKTHDLNQFTRAVASLRPDSVIPYWKGGMHAADFYRAYLNTPWLRKPVMAIPEFHFPRAGRAALLRKSRRTVIRSHCILRREAGRLTPQRLRARILRAVRERGINFIYLEPPKSWTLTQSADFFRELKIELAGMGFSLGAASPSPQKRGGRLAMAILYAALAAVLFLFVWEAALWAVGFTDRNSEVDRVLTIRLRPLYFRWLSLAFFLAMLIIHFEGSAAWAGKIAAWLTACLVPLLSIMLVPPYTAVAALGAKDPLLRAGRNYGLIMLINVLAGLAIGILLFQTPFILRLDVFAGVKAAYVVPLVLAGIYLFPGITDRQWWQARWRKGTRLWTLAGLFLLAAGLFIMLARSGNVSWFPVGDWEIALREGLENLFGIRPRWKEFLIGHPLLLTGLLGLELPQSREKVWPRACLLAGFIGQLSMINTFCHLHTPLHISLVRTMLGVVLGTAIGLGPAFMIRTWIRRKSAR